MRYSGIWLLRIHGHFLLAPPLPQDALGRASGVRLTYPPRYAGRLRAYSRAVLEEPGLPGYTTLGRPALVSRRELLDTSIHEEVHHRLWLRAQRGSRRAWDRIADLDREEAYIE